MGPILAVMGFVLAGTLAYMSAWWGVSVLLRRTDVADVAWGLGFVIVATWGATASAAAGSSRAVLAAAMVGAWGTRLAWHIASRGRRSAGHEDPRYAAMRERAGPGWVWRSLPTVFWLQGALMALVSSPIVVIAAVPPRPLGAVDVVAVAVWAAGFALEAAADAQLARWLGDPAHRGSPLTTGVWAWSRHPNHAGDAIAWWGVGLLAFAGAGLPLGVFTFVGPVAMTLLLRYVSGVPLLEQRHVDDPVWQAYRARTSVFWPMPPRSAAPEGG